MSATEKITGKDWAEFDEMAHGLEQLEQMAVKAEANGLKAPAKSIREDIVVRKREIEQYLIEMGKRCK